MKPRMVLISHGHLAREAQESAKMVMGEIEGLSHVSMLADDGLEGTRTKLKQVLDEIGADVPVLILVDMFFGTPCNVAVETLCARENVRLLTGLNLPMIMEYAVAELEEIDELAAYLCEVGTAATRMVPRPELTSGEEEGYED